jgi:hypothetical protein
VGMSRAMVVVVSVWVVVVGLSWVVVRVAVDERTVAVLVRVYLGLVGVGVAKCWHCFSGYRPVPLGRPVDVGHEISVLMMPTAAHVRTIGMMPTP